jgi:hypothetical protein
MKVMKVYPPVEGHEGFKSIQFEDENKCNFTMKVMKIYPPVEGHEGF